jgi:hypothetical protein
MSYGVNGWVKNDGLNVFLHHFISAVDAAADEIEWRALRFYFH